MSDGKMLPDDEREAFAGFDEMMREDEKRWTPPVCHLMSMTLEESDDEKWWECSYCGHTKNITTGGE